MSEKPGTESPFAAFSAAFPSAMSSFPGASPEAWQKMWSMFTSPAAGAAPGAASFGGMGPSLSMMSELVAPMTNIANLAELDKRITDLRAVEHWLKFNLQMLQSTTQALEVQRATLATLRAFGAAMPGAPAGDTTGTGNGVNEGKPSQGATTPGNAGGFPAMDPALWWGTINDQFKQMAAAAAAATAAAMPSTSAGAGAGAGPGATKAATPGKTPNTKSAGASATTAHGNGTASRRTAR